MYPHPAALASWASQEELDIDSSNEEDDRADGTTDRDPTSTSGQNTK